MGPPSNSGDLNMTFEGVAIEGPHSLVPQRHRTMRGGALSWGSGGLRRAGFDGSGSSGRNPGTVVKSTGILDYRLKPHPPGGVGTVQPPLSLRPHWLEVEGQGETVGQHGFAHPKGEWHALGMVMLRLSRPGLWAESQGLSAYPELEIEYLVIGKWAQWPGGA